MKQLKEHIIANGKIAPGYYKMRIASAYLAEKTKPGQFFEVRVSDKTEPLLRRPFSCHRILKGGVEILYKVVGLATDLLSQKKKGETVDIIGPLGNGFTVKSTVHSPRSTVKINCTFFWGQKRRVKSFVKTILQNWAPKS